MNDDALNCECETCARVRKIMLEHPLLNSADQISVPFKTADFRASGGWVARVLTVEPGETRD